MKLETAVSAILESKLEDSKKSHAIYPDARKTPSL